MTTRFDSQHHFNFNLLPVNDYIVGDVRPALVALLIAVTLVLLIAAVNCSKPHAGAGSVACEGDFHSHGTRRQPGSDHQAGVD